jgi:hypothetical protein
MQERASIAAPAAGCLQQHEPGLPTWRLWQRPQQQAGSSHAEGSSACKASHTSSSLHYREQQQQQAVVQQLAALCRVR